MFTLKHWFAAFGRALGPKKYALGGTAGVAPALYEWARISLDGRMSLPAIPAIWFGLTIILSLIVIWTVQRARTLEIEIEPDLVLEFDGGSPYEITQPLNDSGHSHRFFRIGVRNTGSATINDCLVKLEELRYVDGSTGFYTPIGLITQHQRLQKIASSDTTKRKGGPFILRGDERKFVEVAKLNETEETAQIELQYETDLYENNIPRVNRNEAYELLIRAYGGSKPVGKKFRLFVNEEGFMCMEEMDGG